jgi:hypothetical protein
VNHEIDVVDQDPLSLPVALDLSRPQPGSLQTQLHFVGYGLNLPRIRAAAQDKIVGKSPRPFVHFKN